MYKKISQYLIDIYGPEDGINAADKLETKLLSQEHISSERKNVPDEKNSYLITYGDMVCSEGENKLKTLHKFIRDRLSGTIDSVHILPFYPYSSDDGFSVIDYEQVDPALGEWQDIVDFSKDFKIAADAVFNHISSQSQWFRECLKGNPHYTQYFISIPADTDLSMVTRPRSLPLLSPYTSENGEEHYYWTTFSADQLDLNFANYEVLLRTIEIMLFYASKGITTVRLDAIAFLWKEAGTPCLHLRQTHEIIKIYRRILEEYAPDMILLTETNVPHQENISYFGNNDEAQMVYQFPLPPLTAHAVMTGNAKYLTKWASSLEEPDGYNTFFNFLASHDGIGLRPAFDLLPPDELQNMLDTACDNGGRISYRSLPDGSQSPYELNISYFNLFTSGNDEDKSIAKFLLAHSILMVMPGIPAIYFHSMFGSVNDQKAVEGTGHNRCINREKFTLEQLEYELDMPESRRNRIFSRLKKLLQIRREEPAFHPKSGFEVMHIWPEVFAIRRNTGNPEMELMAIHNLSGKPVSLDLRGERYDIISGKKYKGHVTLAPLEFVWLRENGN